MPTYEDLCKECGEFEKEQRMSDPPLKKCPHCGGAVTRLVGGGGGFVRKGGNWVSKMSSPEEDPKKAADQFMKQTVGEVAEDIAKGTAALSAHRRDAHTILAYSSLSDGDGLAIMSE